MAPQIIILALSFIGLLLTAYMHGKQRTGNHNIFTTIITTIINLLLLLWGGFFSVWFK